MSRADGISVCVFPSDTALLKALYLSTFEATKKWTMSIRNWKYCFENGTFTSDCTMDEMIEFCIPHMVYLLALQMITNTLSAIHLLAFQQTRLNLRFLSGLPSGMPMGDTDEMYGRNKDGSKNEDYCKYCFENGTFTSDCTMDEMIEFCKVDDVYP